MAWCGALQHLNGSRTKRPAGLQIPARLTVEDEAFERETPPACTAIPRSGHALSRDFPAPDVVNDQGPNYRYLSAAQCRGCVLCQQFIQLVCKRVPVTLAQCRWTTGIYATRAQIVQKIPHTQATLDAVC